MYQKKSAKKWFLEKRVSAHGGTSFFFCVCVGGGGRKRLGEAFNSCLDRKAQRSAGA